MDVHHFTGAKSRQAGQHWNYIPQRLTATTDHKTGYRLQQ